MAGAMWHRGIVVGRSPSATFVTALRATIRKRLRLFLKWPSACGKTGLFIFLSATRDCRGGCRFLLLAESSYFDTLPNVYLPE